MATIRGVICLALLISGSCFGDSDLSTLEEKHLKSIASVDGKAFEMKAVQAFWGDSAFMRKCVPPESALPEPLVIYFEVSLDGALGELVISPSNALARCISEAVGDRVFPKPPHEWLGKISLNFTG